MCLNTMADEGGERCPLCRVMLTPGMTERVAVEASIDAGCAPGPASAHQFVGLGGQEVMWHGAQKQSGALGEIPGGVEVATGRGMDCGGAGLRFGLDEGGGGAEQW